MNADRLNSLSLHKNSPAYQAVRRTSVIPPVLLVTQKIHQTILPQLLKVFQYTLRALRRQENLLLGDEGTRTPDLRLAKAPLSQLSYIPARVGLGRLEHPTSRLSGVRSNQLSYRP